LAGNDLFFQFLVVLAVLVIAVTPDIQIGTWASVFSSSSLAKPVAVAFADQRSH
jgi:hypothetical protein